MHSLGAEPWDRLRCVDSSLLGIFEVTWGVVKTGACIQISDIHIYIKMLLIQIQINKYICICIHTHM